MKKKRYMSIEDELWSKLTADIWQSIERTLDREIEEVSLYLEIMNVKTPEPYDSDIRKN